MLVVQNFYLYCWCFQFFCCFISHVNLSCHHSTSDFFSKWFDGPNKFAWENCILFFVQLPLKICDKTPILDSNELFLSNCGSWLDWVSWTQSNEEIALTFLLLKVTKKTWKIISDQAKNIVASLHCYWLFGLWLTSTAFPNYRPV